MAYTSDQISHNLFRTNTTLDDMDQSARSKYNSFVGDVFNDHGVLLLGYSGRRSYAEQWDLRRKYLMEGGAKAAAPGYSWHNYGLALDVVPIAYSGNADWNSAAWDKVGKTGEKNGLVWGASFGDKPHFQDSNGRSLEDLRNANTGWEKYAEMEQSLIDTGVVEEKPKEISKKSTLGLFALLGIGGTLAYFGSKKGR